MTDQVNWISDDVSQTSSRLKSTGGKLVGVPAIGTCKKGTGAKKLPVCHGKVLLNNIPKCERVNKHEMDRTMNESTEQLDPKKKVTSRRSFLDMLLGASLIAWLGAVIYPVVRFLMPPKQPTIDVNSLSVGPLEEFSLNSSKILRFGRNPVLVIRDKVGDMKAFSARCTHLDCNVQYKNDTEQIWCACHNGFYDMEGRNVSGPPPRPLQRYVVSVIDEKIVITRSEGA